MLSNCYIRKALDPYPNLQRFNCVDNISDRFRIVEQDRFKFDP